MSEIVLQEDFFTSLFLKNIAQYTHVSISFADMVLELVIIKKRHSVIN